MPSRPTRWIESCAQGHRLLEEVLDGLTDDLARRDSLLPGWTVGHIVTHLARNADGHVGMVEGAQRGDVVAQYPGGAAQREADIASGHSRPAAELTADLVGAHQRLERAWAAASEEVWATGRCRTMTGLRAIAHTVFLRWREVEVHLADLGLSEHGAPSWDGLSVAYVDAEWIEMTAILNRRVPEGSALFLIPGDRPSRIFGAGEHPVHVRAAPARILQYLMGRGGQPDWPALSPWG